MMAMGELQLVRGMLFTTIQTCHAHFDGPGAPEIAAQKIPRKVQNGAKIIIFALFEFFCVATLGAPCHSNGYGVSVLLSKAPPGTH